MGLQDDGKITFTTVFPGCYAGRWPHCHFEVYESVDEAAAQSLSNLSRLSLTSDNVFIDGWESQLATVSGSADSALTG